MFRSLQITILSGLAGLALAGAVHAGNPAMKKDIVDHTNHRVQMRTWSLSDIPCSSIAFTFHPMYCVVFVKLHYLTI